MSDAPQNNVMNPSGDTVVASQTEFHFVRNPLFRTIYADGAWFNPDINGLMRLTFYNEHIPVPDRVVVDVNSKGFAIGESARDVKPGITRELEIDIIMPMSAAINFHQLLGQNLKNLQEAILKTIPTDAKEAMKKAMK